MSNVCQFNEELSCTFFARSLRAGQRWFSESQFSDEETFKVDIGKADVFVFWSERHAFALF